MAATLQRKSSGGMPSVMITNVIQSKCPKEFFCNHVGQDVAENLRTGSCFGADGKLLRTKDTLLCTTPWDM